MKPTPTLFLAPDLDTAYRHIDLQLQANRRADRFGAVTLLVPTIRAGERLAMRLDDGFGLRIFTFAKLARMLLGQTAQRIHRLDESTLRHVVRRLLAEMAAAGELTTYAPVRDLPGFQQVVIEWLREMKSQGLEPEAILAEAARSSNPRDQQLGRLFARYQAFLQERGAADDDGLLWLAADALAHIDGQSTVGREPIWVAGFDQFTPVQLRILHSLGKRASSFAIYLLWDERCRADGLALTRLRATRSQLESDPELPLDTKQLAQDQSVSPRLLGLRKRLFEAESPSSQPEKEDASAEAAVVAIEAPSREEEVRTALRMVKRLLLQGVPPREIAIRAPQPGVYRRLVQTISEEYGLPVAIDAPLVEQPVTMALIDLLTLWPEYRWRTVFDVLRSPYISHPWLNDEQIAQLDRLTRERPVIAGIDQWRHALRPLPRASKPNRTEDAEDDPGERTSRLLAAALPADTLAEIEEGLNTFFAHLEPPVETTYRNYAEWIQSALLGVFQDDEDNPGDEHDPDTQRTPPSLRILDAARLGPFAQRDEVIVQRVLNLLGRLVMAAEAAYSHDASAVTVPWPVFRERFLEELTRATVRVTPGALIDEESPDGEQGQRWETVDFSAFPDARSTPVDHLFVLGMSEGEFPTTPPPDLFYNREERRQSSLALVERQAGEEASLWWQVLSGARRTITMLRPWVDEGGALWPPSPYWTAALTAAHVKQESGVLRIPVAAALAPAEAAGEAEWLTALAQRGSRPSGATPRRWQRGESGLTLLRARAGRQSPSIYEGVLQADDLLADLTREFGPDSIWSASRLNRYNSCPFGFFVESVLMLEPLSEPEAGMDAAQRGSLLHAALETLFAGLADQQIALTATNLPTILDQLDTVCVDLFHDAPARYGFRPDLLWRYEQRELRRMLRALLRWECEEGDTAFLPYRQEVAFGFQGVDSALALADRDGRTIYVRGFIDRIDRRADGKLRIIDYKSGSTTYSTSAIIGGTALQSALYALAAEQQEAGQGIARSAYLHIPARKESGKLSFTGPVLEDETVQAVVKRVAVTVGLIRSGIFPAAPDRVQDGACASWCQLADICRVTPVGAYKGRRMLDNYDSAAESV